MCDERRKTVVLNVVGIGLVRFDALNFSEALSLCMPKCRDAWNKRKRCITCTLEEIEAQKSSIEEQTKRFFFNWAPAK